MTNKEKIEILKECFKDTIWMAARYAHGRSTYAPSMVRDAVNKFKEVFPDWKMKEDITIEAPDENTLKENPVAFRSDYLDDLYEESK